MFLIVCLIDKPLQWSLNWREAINLYLLTLYHGLQKLLSCGWFTFKRQFWPNLHLHSKSSETNNKIECIFIKILFVFKFNFFRIFWSKSVESDFIKHGCKTEFKPIGHAKICKVVGEPTMIYISDLMIAKVFFKSFTKNNYIQYLKFWGVSGSENGDLFLPLDRVIFERHHFFRRAWHLMSSRGSWIFHKTRI